MTTGEIVVAGAAALGLVVGFPTGCSTSGVLATGTGEGNVGALAVRWEAGVDGVFASFYPMTEHPDSAMSSAGQVEVPN